MTSRSKIAITRSSNITRASKAFGRCSKKDLIPMNFFNSFQLVGNSLPKDRKIGTCDE